MRFRLTDYSSSMVGYTTAEVDHFNQILTFMHFKLSSLQCMCLFVLIGYEQLAGLYWSDWFSLIVLGTLKPVHTM